MRHVGTRPLDTPRLHLRRFVPGDAQAMYEGWANDPEVTQFLRWTPHADVNETRAVLEGWQPLYQQPSYYHWAVQRKEDGVLVGTVGIFENTDEAEGPLGWEPAYCYGRAFWGQGYATEALQAALAEFTRETGIRRLNCCHAKANPASGRVMEHVGFRYTRDGTYTRFDGSVVPARWYALNLNDSGGKETD